MLPCRLRDSGGPGHEGGSGGGDEVLRNPVGRTRLEILEWLKDPAAHFPRGRGRHADPVEDGVTARAVAAKLGVSRRVADNHLRLLAGIGLLRTKRIRRRIHYRCDEVRIAEVSRLFEKGW